MHRGWRRGEEKGVRREKKDWTYVSARMIRVRLAFSMVNFVLPSWPAIRPEEVKRYEES